ncbi:hypothetical protein ACWKSP_22325 [Micromonosporaceae bacterium Da 78-11]
MPSLCWLHPEGDEHEAARPAGLQLSDGQVIPIDRSCRNAETILDHQLIVEWASVNVDAVRS